MNRILIIRGGAIGDFVLTLPAITLLRQGYPQARLEILGYKHIAALGYQRFYADGIRSLESGPLARFFARDAGLPDEWADYFASFDLIVSYLFDPDKIFERNLRRCGVEDIIAASPKVLEDGEHATEQLARPLRELDLTLRESGAVLHPSDEDREFARNSYPESAIALHPGSGGASKNWPLQHWIRLLEETDLAKSPVIVVVGEADRAQLDAFRSASRKNVHFAESLPLPHLAAVLQQSRFFLGHDSGISHIAAAVGAPCLLLFGPTNPKVWAPQNKQVRVLRVASRQMADLRPDEVAAALANFTN